jgi:hypothetical protein
MGCLFYPREQTSASYAADCDVIVCYGAAEPADQAIAACGGDAREAVKALIVANQFLESDLEKLWAAVSTGYARGKLFEAAKTMPRDRKDWYD